LPREQRLSLAARDEDFEPGSVPGPLVVSVPGDTLPRLAGGETPPESRGPLYGTEVLLARPGPVNWEQLLAVLAQTPARLESVGTPAAVLGGVGAGYLLAGALSQTADTPDRDDRDRVGREVRRPWPE
jgi:hypothetical protein